MSKKWKTTAMLLIAATLAAGAAFAQGGMMPGGGMGGFGPENLGAFRMLAQRLDLTEDQTAEIESILEETRLEVQVLMEAAGPPEERVRFMDLFTQPDLTVADLEETLGGMNDTREAIREVIFEAIVDIHDVLTPSQLEELAVIVEEHAGMAPGVTGSCPGGMGGSCSGFGEHPR